MNSVFVILKDHIQLSFWQSYKSFRQIFSLANYLRKKWYFKNKTSILSSAMIGKKKRMKIKERERENDVTFTYLKSVESENVLTSLQNERG